MAWCKPQIEFDRDVYFPGEQVTGRAFLSTEEGLKARKVEISFFGKAVTAWIEEGKRRNIPVETHSHRQGEEIYVEVKNNVWTPKDDDNAFPAGEYEWKFSFDLPKECPASFESKFGFIRYYVLFHIDVPRWFDSKVEKAITVSPTIDLNSIPGAKNPARLQIDKISQKLACLPFFGNNGSVTYILSSDRVGYVAGDHFRVNAIIENHSTKPLCEIEAIFKRRIVNRKELRNSIFKPPRDTKSTPDRYNSRIDEYVFETKTEECDIAPGMTKNFSYSFLVPPVVATIRNSNFISVEYLVTIAADRQFFDPSPIPTFNIIVGNVPFLEGGSTTLPPHRFVKGDEAQCWTCDLAEPKFCSQLPYFGNDYSSAKESDSEDHK